MGGLGKQTSTPPTPPSRHADIQRRDSNKRSGELAGFERITDTRPPVLLFLLSVITTLLSFYFLLGRGISGHGLFHFAGVVFGMVIGGALMGLFRQNINARQVTGTFSDWAVSSVALGTSVSIVGWLIGLANLILVSIDISRAL
jgi:hypothetical protein